jgi:D-arabinose 1-dehydrogenase-like Zn-dependent alcohol dehydrogenase
MTKETAQATLVVEGATSGQTSETRAYGAPSATSRLEPVTIRRRAPRPQDVQIDVLFCGICHSDLHQVRNEWQGTMPTVYPCVPGHEVVGRDGTLTLVGAPETPSPLRTIGLLFGRRRLAGSLIGGLRETQEMLDFSAEHGITSDVEVIPMQQINEAYDRLARGDVKYRFVVDMASLK